jgi:iron complex transport system ATP-binding protein
MISHRQLTIVTGPIDSGKTSWCRELAAAHPDCSGVLLIKVYFKGERIGYDALQLSAGHRTPFARSGGHEPAGWTAGDQVGPFSISTAGLKAANAWLIEAAAEPGCIIVDEVGPLELGGGGLSPGLRAVLASTLAQKIYVVIRSDCVEAVREHFGITGYAVVDMREDPGKEVRG